MYDSDQFSFSMISTAGDETIYTPTDQGTDDFELLDDDHSVKSYQSYASSDGSTSVTPSVCSYEFEHGRRYHGYKSGRYPLPNDAGEKHREETRHALMLEAAVSVSTIELLFMIAIGRETDHFEGGPALLVQCWRQSAKDHGCWDRIR